MSGFRCYLADDGQAKILELRIPLRAVRTILRARKPAMFTHYITTEGGASAENSFALPSLIYLEER
jgi:hypothetical protein